MFATVSAPIVHMTHEATVAHFDDANEQQTGDELCERAAEQGSNIEEVKDYYDPENEGRDGTNHITRVEVL